MMNRRNKFPFTPSQWQELEHQALIYKYIASGISIPPDLIFSIKRSYLDSPISSRLLPHHPQHFRWNYLPMGLGRKIDPEPGRCRRTDGKKWRCSKEAYPDSKYCERHMHRGKNRSRKPVEVLKTTNNTYASSTSTTPSSILSITKNNPALAPTTAQNIFHHHPHQHSSSSYGSHLQQHSFLYHHPPPSRPSSTGLYFQDNNSASLFLDNASCSQNNTDSRNRYVYGQKEEVDEHAFFNEPSGNMRSFSASSIDDSWNLTPLSINSPSSSKQRNFSGLTNNDNEYSYLQLQSLSDNSKQQPKQDQGFYNDIKCEKFMKLGDKEEPPQQKTVHRFFDEWPPKSRGTWLDLDDKSSTTQLSISIPTSHDFGTFSSRNQRDG